MTVTKSGYVPGTRFQFELDGDVLTIRHENYEVDSGAGERQAVSVWYRALEIVEMEKNGPLAHCGGHCSGQVREISRDSESLDD
jgi:hypothetical protein